MSTINKNFNKLFGEVDKSNKYASTLDEPGLTKISGWLNTGFYGLNAITSADVYKGIPFGRITTLFGPSQSGKSLLSALLQKDAQRQGMRVILFDSEFDKDGRMEQSFGVDTSIVKVVPVETIEDLTTQSNRILRFIMDNDLHGKVFLVLDSLAGLSSEKELKDAESTKSPSDMGLRAKAIRSFYRTIKGKCSLSKCPFLIINHEAKNPGEMYESSFKLQSGGEAIEYFSTVMLYVGKRKEKTEDKKETSEDGFTLDQLLVKNNITGQTLKFFTQKNRIASPHKEIECYINFDKGINPYSGLKPMLDKMENLYLKDTHGEIGKGYTFYLKTEDDEIKLGKYKDWESNKEIWEKYLLPELNKFVNKAFAYKEHE